MHVLPLACLAAIAAPPCNSWHACCRLAHSACCTTCASMGALLRPSCARMACGVLSPLSSHTLAQRHGPASVMSLLCTDLVHLAAGAGSKAEWKSCMQLIPCQCHLVCAYEPFASLSSEPADWAEFGVSVGWLDQEI